MSDESTPGRHNRSSGIFLPPALVTRNLSEAGDRRLEGKRVAMVTFSLYPYDPRPRRAAEALINGGMSVDLICVTEYDHQPRRQIVNGVDVLRLPLRPIRGTALRYGFQYSGFLFISAAILAMRSLGRGYDLVYVHNMPDFLVLSGLIPKLFGAKLILDLHDPMPELMMGIYGLQPQARAVRLLRWLEKWSIAVADSVVTVNRACADLFVSRSCPPKKMNVVMNTPDERIFRFRPSRPVTTSRSNNRFVVMYHGALVERNGLDIAIEALDKVRDIIPQTELRVYGIPTPYLDRVMDLVGRKGLNGVIQYLGPRSLEQLVPAIEDCDVGVIPNRRNAFTQLNTPTRIFEYLALGKPVIAPRAPGICDYFDESSLLFFELGDAVDLGQKIKFAASHPAELADLARRGQMIYRDHIWEEERQRLLGMIARLFGSELADIVSEGRADSSTERATVSKS